MKLLILVVVALLPTLAIGQSNALTIHQDTSISFTRQLFFEKDHLSKNIATEFDFKSMKPTAIFPKHTVTGVFCRMEHRIEATSNFAPRFRLGSVNYTDWMEGKKPFLSRYAK